MLLYLVRHAVAFARDAQTWPDDRERPLTPRGIKRFRQAARGLRALNATVNVVLSSPAVRAWDTAIILERAAKWPSPLPCEALESGLSPTAALAALQPYRAVNAVALVGHEPHMHELASLLLTGDGGRAAVEFRKGGVALLRLDDPAVPGTATLLWHVTPKLLRGLVC